MCASTCSVTCWPFTKVPNLDPLSRSTNPLASEVMSAWSRDTSVPERRIGAFAAPAKRGDLAIQLNSFRSPAGAGNHEPWIVHVRLRLRMRQTSTTAARAATV